MRYGILPILAFLCAAALAEDGPPIDVEVFYSQDDPYWMEAEKKIAATQQRFPRLRITKISYDDDAGYKKLTAREKELGLKESADLRILLGPISLASKGKERNAENGFEAVVSRVLNPGAGKGRLDGKPLEYANARFGAEAVAAKLGEIQDGEIVFYRVSTGGKTVGYLVDAYLPIKCPMCNDTQFQFATDAQFKITHIHAVREMELYGVPLSIERARVFLKQFEGRAPSDTPQEVDGISGATRTVSSYENGIHTILNELKERATK